jgi:hypothetical protein
LKIGGYASCGFYALTDSFISGAKSSPRMEYFLEFFDGFLKYIREFDCPLDFFSWHSYDNIENNKLYAEYARKRLDEAGYAMTETTCNEWNCDINSRGTTHHAAVTCGMMLAFQDMPLDSAMFYDARFGTSIYGSLFNPLTAEPFPTYYAFQAFNELYKLGAQIETLCDDRTVYAVGARKDNKVCVLLANPTTDDVDFILNAKGCVTKCLITAQDKCAQEIEMPDILPSNSFLLIHIEI